MKRVVAWQRVDTLGAEYAELSNAPTCMEGEVVLVDDGEPCAVSYRVDCDDAGSTTRAFVRSKRRGLLTTRTLVRLPRGAWTVDDQARPELTGLCDVDLSVTPSTNTLPIRRLGLAIGQRAEVTASWVRFPRLDVVPLRQVYRRVDGARYEYDAPDHAFHAELTVDEDGIVCTYGGLWKRAPL